MKKTKLFAWFLLSLALCSCEANRKNDQNKTQYETGQHPEAAKAERNKKVVMASMDALNQGNVDEMLKELDAQATEYFDGSTPPVKGRDSIIAGIKGYVSAFPDIKGTNFKILAEGDHVMAYGEWTATFKNDFMGVKATGKTVRYSDVDMFRFNNEGKVVEHRSLFPVSQIMRMAGVQ